MYAQRPFTVLLEGNIGSGKSIIGNYLQHYNEYTERYTAFISEPLNKWRDVGGINLFGRFTVDPETYAFPFQAYASATLSEIHLRQLEGDKSIKMIERSIYSSFYCFAKILNNKRLLCEYEYEILKETFENSRSNPKMGCNLIVYIDTTPEICLERIKIRNRPEEKFVTLEYLQELKRAYDDWLLYGVHERPSGIIVIKNNHDWPECLAAYNNLANRVIKKRIENLETFFKDTRHM